MCVFVTLSCVLFLSHGGTGSDSRAVSLGFQIEYVKARRMPWGRGDKYSFEVFSQSAFEIVDLKYLEKGSLLRKFNFFRSWK